LFRLVCIFLILVGCALAQATAPPSESASTMVVSESMDSNGVTPNPLSPAPVNTPASLPGVPPLPSGKTTLLGGTIGKVDHIRDRLVLDLFGGGQYIVFFDERTRVLRQGQRASVDDLKKGDRVYVDTTLDGIDIFARTVRLTETAPTGQSSGQILGFKPEKGELILRDELSPEPVKMRIGADTVIQQGDKPATSSNLRPGTLVALSFLPGFGGMPKVSRISILASPGALFVFSGHIQDFDLHRGLLVLLDPRDNQSYQVTVSPYTQGLMRDLRQGMDITVQASFNGRSYEARDITIIPKPNN
jgi:hypothetical protein